MIISRTPLRVSLFGGGTDFADYFQNSKFKYGTVVSTAINMYSYMTVNKKFDDMIRVSYSKTEHVDNLDKIEHNIIREALRLVGIEKGIDIVYMADVPLGHEGIGLASSSALAVGVLNALHVYNGQHSSAEKLAKEACEIELNRLHNPIGIQDQYAVAFGGFNRYQFNADGTVFVDPVICKKETKQLLERRLMFFYSGITRQSHTVLTEQKQNISSKMDKLDRLVEISDEAFRNLEDNDLSQIGEMLDEAWAIKKQMAGNVSGQVIDEMYDRARNAGAEGGKILGAGGGGFLMVYVPEEKQEDVRTAMSEFKEADISFEPQGSSIIYIN